MADATCSVRGCLGTPRSNGVCRPHEQRIRRHGDPQADIPIKSRGRQLPWPTSLLARLKVTDDGCVEFTGFIDRHGYGILHRRMAHRLMYEFMVGPIPDGLQIDHLCRNTACVNPGHLEPVTPAENVRRAFERKRQRDAAAEAPTIPVA